MLLVKALSSKSTWFQKSKDSQVKPEGHQVKRHLRKGPRGAIENPETVLFVPHTPEGELKVVLQNMDREVCGNRTTGKVRVVESIGNSLISSLGNMAPWRGEGCAR